MADETGIEWCDSTFNYWVGCQKNGPGCDHCYAEAWNARFAGIKIEGVSVAPNFGPGAPRRLTSQHNRNNLRRWNAERFLECNCGWRGGEKEMRKASGCPACGDGLMLMSTRRRVFCSSLSDVFDNAVPQEWRDALFAEMEAAPNLDFLVLTKRVGNVRKMVPASWLEPGGWPAHVWLGATIVNQTEIDRDIPKLLAVPAAKRFLSMEPLLGPVDLGLCDCDGGSRPGPSGAGGVTCTRCGGAGGQLVDWVIVGGESGHGARPMHPDWARNLRDQCEAAGVPFLFKQWGEWADIEHTPADWWNSRTEAERRNLTQSFIDGKAMNRIGKKAAGRMLDGRTWDGVPS